MAILTEKQERFCAAYVETNNQTEAYRRAYDTATMSNASIKASAHKVMKSQRVIDRIAELRAPAAKAATLTLEKHLRDLERLRDKAERLKDFGPAIRAEVARGKAAGLYVEKIDLNLTGSLAERLARARKRNG